MWAVGYDHGNAASSSSISIGATLFACLHLKIHLLFYVEEQSRAWKPRGLTGLVGLGPIFITYASARVGLGHICARSHLKCKTKTAYVCCQWTIWILFCIEEFLVCQSLTVVCHGQSITMVSHQTGGGMAVHWKEAFACFLHKCSKVSFLLVGKKVINQYNGNRIKMELVITVLGLNLSAKRCTVCAWRE